MDVRFSPTQYGLKLASCSEDGMLRVYDAQDFSEFRIWTLDQQIAVSPPPSSPLSSPFPPSSPYRVGLLSVLQLGSGGGGCVVDVCGGDKSWGQGWCGKPGVCGGCVSLDWLDGREDVMVIAVATGAGMLQVWGRSVSHHHKWILLQQTQKPAHWGGCKHVAWSPRLSRDHDMLCTCGGEPAVMLWAWHLSESDAELLCEAGRWSSGFLHGSSQSLNAMECPSSPEDNTSESPPSQHNPRQQGQGNEGVKPTASATDSDVTGLSSIDLGDMPGAEEDGRQQGMSQSHETQYEITGERDKQLQALRNMCKDQLSLQALPCQQQHAVDGRGNREGVVIVQEQKTVDAADELSSQSSRHHDNLSSPSTPPLSPPHPTPIPSLPPSNPPPSSLPSSLLRSPHHILSPHPPALIPSRHCSPPHRRTLPPSPPPLPPTSRRVPPPVRRHTLRASSRLSADILHPSSACSSNLLSSVSHPLLSALAPSPASLVSNPGRMDGERRSPPPCVGRSFFKRYNGFTHRSRGSFIYTQSANLSTPPQSTQQHSVTSSPAASSTLIDYLLGNTITNQSNLRSPRTQRRLSLPASSSLPSLLHLPSSPPPSPPSPSSFPPPPCLGELTAGRGNQQEGGESMPHLVSAPPMSCPLVRPSSTSSSSLHTLAHHPSHLYPVSSLRHQLPPPPSTLHDASISHTEGERLGTVPSISEERSDWLCSHCNGTGMCGECRRGEGESLLASPKTGGDDVGGREACVPGEHGGW
eukprot:GHVQ01035485.1.p1 GENE.GHVQ01035485.1~~GHVQ01035485.1.p1  ORF type:complete len:751 (+),score=177.15 GHVQ01035485.1:549-2801(+)